MIFFPENNENNEIFEKTYEILQVMPLKGVLHKYYVGYRDVSLILGFAVGAHCEGVKTKEPRKPQILHVLLNTGFLT